MVSTSQLARRIAARGASSSQARHAVEAVLGEITAALAAGEKVTLVGFGTFEPVARAARSARNPRTGASVPVPAATVARFHPGAALRAAVDGGPVALGAVGSLAEKPIAEAPGLVVPAPKPAKGVEPAKPAKGKAAKGKAAKGKAAKGKPAKGKPAKDARGKGTKAAGKRTG